jgi:hypothetical protein
VCEVCKGQVSEREIILSVVPVENACGNRSLEATAKTFETYEPLGWLSSSHVIGVVSDDVASMTEGEN